MVFLVGFAIFMIAAGIGAAISYGLVHICGNRKWVVWPTVIVTILLGTVVGVAYHFESLMTPFGAALVIGAWQATTKKVKHEPLKLEEDV